jgi:tetratricopeptide (TPR) repeat protein
VGCCCSATPLFLCACLALAAAPARAQTAQGLRDQAFELAYNLDHERAEAKLAEVLRVAPDEAATHRTIASITWLNLLFRTGAITVDHYLGGLTRRVVEKEKPPAEIDARFKRHILRAVELGHDRVEEEPRNPDAHYDLGASLGLRASYTASAEGRLMAGFRAAKGAFDAHETVLELDPKRHDAGLIVGTYRYVVASLSLPMRWMAYIVGFGGGKERGIAMIRQAAAFAGESRTEARFALILIYNREKRYDEALAIIRELQREFPRNRLLKLEYGGTSLRAGRPLDAERVLSEGIAELAEDARPRAGNEEAMWHYKRGAALVELKRLEQAEADLQLAAGRPVASWIRGRSIVELGKIADMRGDREGARRRYRQGASLCEGDRDPRGAAEGRRWLERPYKG